MTGGDGSGGGKVTGESEPTAEDCVRAGTYWFGRGDLPAAEAWWQRARELDPGNARAEECLRLLHRSASRSPSAGDRPAPSASRPAPPSSVARPVSGSESWADAVARLASEARAVSLESSRRAAALRSQGGAPRSGSTSVASPVAAPASPLAAPEPTPAPARSVRDSAPPASVPTDPLDFASVVPRGESLQGPAPSAAARSPWDEGPSRTAAVTLRDDGGFDAVAEPTPLPELDRELFFGRTEPRSREEIVDYLRAAGELPVPEPVPDAPDDLVFDEPVELPGARLELDSRDPEALLYVARDRQALHDFDGVLEALESLPSEVKSRDEARALATQARSNLLRMHESKIGDFGRSPRVLLTSDQLIWLNLDHRAGFILSQIDGVVSYEDLVALSGMPRLDTVRILAQLVQDRVIG